MRQVNMTSLGERHGQVSIRNAKCSNCGKTGHLRAMCRQREKSACRSSPSSSSGKSSGKSGTSRGSTDKCCCCGQVGLRRPDCPRRNENCSLCGKRGHLSQVCRSSGGNASARSKRNPLSLRRREKFNTCGHCQSVIFLDSRWTLCLFPTTPMSRLTNLVTC